ncbi:MAG: sugar phosphate isomerase/epimerase family protein [Planctomycetota bacterium]|jgi:sugar phosphate isomerase/epimerase
MTDKKESMSRRDFIRNSVNGATVLVSTSMLASCTSAVKVPSTQTKAPSLRLGGPIFEKFDGPDAWVAVIKRLGYRAAYCPLEAKESDNVVNAYAKAAQKAGITIAEVGAWSNPISPNEKTRRSALAKCREQLALADRIGAKCCVNISGSRSKKQWAGPHEDNLTQETFDLIVETTRAIIDDIKPTRTHFTLEAMPWSYPDSPDSYLRLIKAIDRRQFAVHLDPVNFVSSPQLYFKNAELIRQCFTKLGPHIKSCHAKDILLREDIYTPHLDELRPGLGRLDYATYLTELSKFPDTPLMLEHLPNAEEYRLAAEHIRSVAKKVGLSFG